MVPWNKKSDINLHASEFNQELGLNRIANRLLENDTYIKNKIENALIGNTVNLVFASKDEVISLSPSNKILTPYNIMSLSATTNDIIDGVDDKFITPKDYKQLINSNIPKTIFVDLSHHGSFSSKNVKPTNAQILSKVNSEISMNIIPENTLLYVWYMWSKYSHRTRHRKHWYGGHYHKYWYYDCLESNTYKRVNNYWSLIRNRQMTIKEDNNRRTYI